MEIFGAFIAVISGASIIITAVIKTYKFFRSFERKLDGLNERLTENNLCTYRLTILNEKLEPTERIEYGKKYIELGGNGVAKHIVQELEDELYYERYKGGNINEK